MKSRLLAAILSVSLLFSSMPVMAAEPGNGIPSAGGAISSDQKTEEDVSNGEATDSDSSNGDSANKDTSNEDSANESTSGEDNSNENIPNEEASNEDTSNEDSSNGNTSNEDSSNGNTSNEDSSDNDNDNTQDSDVNNPDENTGDDTVAPDTEAGEDAETEEPAREDEAEEPVNVEDEDITELKVGENTLTLVNNTEEYMALWYSFTAPESGYFNFHTDNYYSKYLHNRTDASYFRYGSYNLYTDYMDTGETVYMKLDLYSNTNASEILTINKLTSYTSQKQDDGSYLFDAGDYTLSVLPEFGNSHIRANASVEAKDDKTLDSRYYLSTYLDAPDTYSSYSNISLYSYNNYKDSAAFTADAGKEYNLHFLLVDDGYSSSNVSAIFIIDEPVSIKNVTDNVVTIHNTEKTETSITMDIESSQGLKCYYAPTDNSVEEKNLSVYNGWQEYKFTSLQLATEYYFQFVNSSSGKIVYETTESTTEYDINVVYNAEFSTDNKLTLKADVSGYKGSATYGYLLLEYTNALGDLVNDSFNLTSDGSDDNGNKFTKEITLDSAILFEAGQSYDIIMSIRLGSVIVDKTVKSIEMPNAPINASDLEFNVVSDETTPTTANYTIKANNLNEDTALNYQLYYKQTGSKDKYSKYSITGTLSASASEKTGSITYLQKGCNYEFIIIAGGIKKTVENVAMGTSDVSLSKVDEDTINAFDFVRTYKLVNAEGTDVSSGNYSLRLYYSNDNYYTQISGINIVFDAENSYKAEIKTASSGTKLNPDTDYDLKWELRNSDNNTVVYTSYETIHTNAARITFTETGNSNCYNQEYQITLDPDDINNFTNFGSLYLYAYIKKTGDTIYRKNSEISLSSGNEYSRTLNLTGLEANTSYDVVLRTNSGVEYASKTFITAEDNRELSVTEVIEKLHSAEIKYTLTGITSSMSGNVLCYIHEKGSSDAWVRADSNYYSGSSGDTNSGTLWISTYNNKELKDSTEYEYKIGLGSDYNTAVADLDKVYESSFTTKKDNRILSNAAASASYTNVDISALLSSNDDNLGTCIYLFLKRSTDLNWDRVYIDDYGSYYKYTSATSYNYSAQAYGLSPGTDYSYMIVASDSYDCSSPDEVTVDSRKAGGNFTTKENSYTFDFTTDEGKLTNNTAVVNVTAKGGDDERLRVEFTLNDGQNEVQTQTVTLKASEDYKGEITFTNLIGETQYTITSAYISAVEGTSYTDIGETVCNHTFTTKEAEVPTEITLSTSEITLNALYSSSYYDLDGYKSKTLKVNVTPATAAKDFKWSSSDENIAVVDSDGMVSATGGVGTATITVESAYSDNIKASCQVIVKKYAVGHKYTDENRIDQIEYVTGNGNEFYNSGFALYKNSYIEGMGLYDYSDENNPTLLSNYTTVSAREKISEVKGNQLHAYEPGKTYIDFEKDGVKARINVLVSAEGKGFGITEFTTYSNYPAIKEKDGSYTLAYEEGRSISYTAKIEVSPKQNKCSVSDFNWSISGQDSDQTIASVNDYGVVTPLKAGTVTLTVTPKKYYTTNEVPYKTTELKVTLNIKNVPTQGDKKQIYALANVHAKIGDVPFPAGTESEQNWGDGWSWKYPNTPLVTNGVYSNNSYPFEAVYNGTESYPCETTISVNIGRITGVNVSESIQTAGTTAHNNVLEVSAEDSIALNVSPIYQGRISSDTYSVEIPSVSGLTITPDANNKQLFRITAQKKGNYTLKPVIKADKKVIASTTYKIKAVEDKQVASIVITSNTDDVSIVGNTIIFNKKDEKKEFTLNAVVKDRSNNEIDTALVWKTTDKTVATVAPASKSDTHSVKVSIKGDGHTVLSATAKDAAGFSKTINLEVQDHRPRIDTDKANVNIAYDYSNTTGRSYAYDSGGAVEIVPVYGESISADNLQMRDKTGETPLTDLKIVQFSGYKYLIQPASDSLKAGKYDCMIYVKTSADNEYTYPVKVTVTDKAPTVSAKTGIVPNLFFKNTNATIYLKISGAKYVNSSTVDSSSITWTAASGEANTGFSVNYASYDYNKKLPYIAMSQQSGMKLTNGKLADANAAKGKLSLKLTGYKKAYTIDNFTIKYSYKKPALVTKAANSNIAPDVGQNNSTSFYVFDKTNKRWLYYDPFEAGSYYNRYDEIKCDVADIELLKNDGSEWLSYRYNGNEKSKKFTLTLDAPLWRESLTASHTMKTVKPTAYLTSNTITYNTNLKSTAYNYIRLKNAVNISFSDIEIKGANAKAQKLLQDDLFVITAQDDYSNEIRISQSQAEFMGSSIPAGTYAFKVTPYYNKPETNEKTALNTVTFKLKVVNKAVTAKVSPKGSIDLTYGTNYTPSDRKNIVALVDPKFSNMADEYYVSGYSLTGEYSDYFTLNRGSITYGKKYAYHYYIGVRDNTSTRKLKAGQAYKLAIEYTISNGEGEEFTVTSNTFTIKPKQSAPKVTVINNNQTLYAGAADNLTRAYSLSVPSYYSISSAYGSIDCNKDGRADITVNGGSSLTVKIYDKDAVGATAKGKTYSIPITVRLVGRDGIAKDVKTTIKVKIKR